MSAQRKPASFKLDEDVKPSMAKKTAAAAKRAPVAVREPASVVVSPADEDPFMNETASPQMTIGPTVKSRGWRLGAIFLTAAGAFVSLAIGLWAERLISDFFARSEWLGWLASGLAVLALVALVAIAAREALSLIRLRSVEKLQKRGRDIVDRGDMPEARKLVADLAAFTSKNPATAKGRQTIAGLEHEVIDAGDLVAIAERELFANLDREAREMVLQSARRVSVVTAVSPRALIDVAYVLFESGRLIRRISQLYGGRPGTIGFVKLIRDVSAHLAVTGSIAVGDSLIQQVVGHGIASRLSARLGEGVINGLMTVRIGIAAMETARPLPFNAVKRPGVGDFLTALAGTATGGKSDR